MLDEEQKNIEKILKDLASLQVRACVLSSQSTKGAMAEENFDMARETDFAEEIEQISVEFADITKKLAKKLNSPSIEKTLNKLELSSFYNPGLASFYLTQLIHEMKGVADKTKRVLNINAIENQYKQELEQKKINQAQAEVVDIQPEKKEPLTTKIVSMIDLKPADEILVYQAI